MGCEETVYATDISAGCFPRDEKIVFDKLQELEKKYDNIVALTHWGFEYNRLPQPYDISFAHKILDIEYVKMIIGSHSHCIQAHEVYNDKHIYYSLGNFYFSSKRNNFKKKFNEKVENQSDFGIGIVIDFSFSKSEELIIKYDRKLQKTIIDSEDLLIELNNENFTSFGYYNKVKANKKNFNPILTNNKCLNFIKLKSLYLFYWLKKIIKKILKRK